MPKNESQIDMKDELEKMAREASPEIWLSDAHTEIQTWIPKMARAKEIGLDSKLDLNPGHPNPAPRLTLSSRNGWSETDGFAFFFVRPSGIKCNWRVDGDRQEVLLGNEQEFKLFVLQLLQASLGKSAWPKAQSIAA